MTTVALFVLAAVIVGYSKTALGGLATISVAIYATILPARQSTGALLLLLMVGDLVAVWHYRRHCDWAIVRELLPLVVPGLVLGAGFLAVVDDTWLRRSIGALLLVMVALQLVLQARAGRVTVPASSTRTAGRGAGLSAGLAAGFVTMTANAAGAVMTLFLVSRGVEKRRFVGTSAWFFAGVNLCKLPFSVGLGLVHLEDLRRAVLLAPAVLLGGWLGVHTIARISQRRFEQAVLLASAVAALALIVR